MTATIAEPGVSPDLGRIALVLDCRFPLRVSPETAQAMLGRVIEHAAAELGVYLQSAGMAANDTAAEVLAVVEGK